MRTNELKLSPARMEGFLEGESPTLGTSRPQEQSSHNRGEGGEIQGKEGIRNSLSTDTNLPCPSGTDSSLEAPDRETGDCAVGVNL